MLSGTHRYPRQEQVIYGRPAVEAAAALAGQYGARRLLVISTRSLEASAKRLAGGLGDLSAGVFTGMSAHSPREGVIAGAKAAREANADLLVAFGGGSVIDATKVVQLALWAGLETPAALGPYRSGRGPDRINASALTPGVRMIAIPTALSAAEFTAFAGVTDAAAKAKEGYGHPELAPRAVILDPAVTLETPERLWFSTGLKAVDHAVEQLCNRERAPFADAVAEEGLRRLTRGLHATKAAPDDLEARLECQFGMWLAISGAASGRGMGASHAIGHTLGGSYGVPHGITSCVALPAVLAWNAGVSEERQARIAELMGAPDEPGSDVVRRLASLLGLPTRLSEVGITEADFQHIAEHTMTDRGVRSNPRPITGPADIVEILRLAA